MGAHPASLSEAGITRRRTIAGFSLKEFSQPPYRSLPWHEHSDSSICFVLAGSYRERVGGMDWECAPHSTVFKPASERHADQFGRLGGRCLLIEMSPGRMAAVEPFAAFTARPSRFRNARLAALGHRIWKEFTWVDACTPLAVEALILEVLVEASRAAAGEPGATRPHWLRQAHELIHDSYCQPLTLSSIAAAVNIHPSHLARTFRRHFRVAIGDYIRRLRLEHASRELAETDIPLAAVAQRSGFFDQSHFSRLFRDHTGLTPAQFRAASCGNARTRPHRAS